MSEALETVLSVGSKDEDIGQRIFIYFESITLYR